MLFNTLANLRALIGHDTDQAIEMLDRLDSLLRETLKSSRSTHHALAHELTVLEDYLALMKVRMGERLSYSFNIAEASRRIQVPALILQPLVENAIRHGIDPLLEGGHIRIDAQLANNKLTLVVEDSGKGMDSKIIESMDANQSETAIYKKVRSTDEQDTSFSNGFGLENLRQRLHQSYGDKASIQFTRAFELSAASAEATSVEARDGTRVTVQLPGKQQA